MKMISKTSLLKRINFPLVIGLIVLTSSCKTTPIQEIPNEPGPINLPIGNEDYIYLYSEKMSCSIEILEKTTTQGTNDYGSLSASLVDENKQPLANIPVFIDSVEIGTMTNTDGDFFFDKISPGNHVLRFKYLGSENCAIAVNLAKGDQVNLNLIAYIYPQDVNMKPIIYIYPEEKTEVEVELIYDGKITTTYPKLPADGWKVTAFSDGTLIDENQKEYYALYWEGEPRNSLKIQDGFVVSNEQTIPFLEETLARLGLNPKESNEFIIFWLPILEKNDFNLIHFAEDDYVEQSQLNISPTPETVIRVMMVFQGLDEEIEFPLQDLTPLTKSRNGFTVIEWGGTESKKNHKLGI